MSLQYLINEVLEHYSIIVLLLRLFKNFLRDIPIEYSTITDIVLVDSVEGMIDLVLV